MFKFSENSLKKLATCEKDLQKVAMLAIMISEVDFGISCGHRTPEEQYELYMQGRSKPGKIVTNVDGIRVLGKHNRTPSKAFDVYAWVDGKLSWDVEYYHKINEAVQLAADTLNVQIDWGGEWGGFRDYPHFQLTT